MNNKYNVKNYEVSFNLKGSPNMNKTSCKSNCNSSCNNTKSCGCSNCYAQARICELENKLEQCSEANCRLKEFWKNHQDGSGTGPIFDNILEIIKNIEEKIKNCLGSGTTPPDWAGKLPELIDKLPGDGLTDLDLSNILSILKNIRDKLASINGCEEECKNKLKEIIANHKEEIKNIFELGYEKGKEYCKNHLVTDRPDIKDIIDKITSGGVDLGQLRNWLNNHLNPSLETETLEISEPSLESISGTAPNQRIVNEENVSELEQLNNLNSLTLEELKTKVNDFISSGSGGLGGGTSNITRTLCNRVTLVPEKNILPGGLGVPTPINFGTNSCYSFQQYEMSMVVNGSQYFYQFLLPPSKEWFSQYIPKESPHGFMFKTSDGKFGHLHILWTDEYNLTAHIDGEIDSNGLKIEIVGLQWI